MGDPWFDPSGEANSHGVTPTIGLEPETFPLPWECSTIWATQANKFFANISSKMLVQKSTNYTT